MGKFDGLLICTDLDGTLYKNDKTISTENKQAIDFFKREGGYFTFITGRMPYYSKDAFNAISPNAPFGCINGGGIYDGHKKEYVWRRELPLVALELVSLIDENYTDVGIQLCCFERTCFARENGTTVRFRQRTGLPEIFCDYHGFSEPLGKIMFCTDDEEKILGIERDLKSHPKSDIFDFIRSEKTLFEILPKHSSKGASLKVLADHLKIDIKRTVAVGDYDNDASMLRTAGCGIAVSNASKSALEAARFVTVSNEEHAIAKIIYDIERGRLPL